MKLKQTLTIDDVTTTQINNGDMFGHLFNAQFQLACQRPELGEHWLQAHPLLTHFMGILAHAGKVEIFSLADQLHIKIEWIWLTDAQVAASLLPAPEQDAIVVPG